MNYPMAEAFGYYDLVRPKGMEDDIGILQKEE